MFGRIPATKATGETTTSTITAACRINKINTIIINARAAEKINNRIEDPAAKAPEMAAAVPTPIAAAVFPPLRICSTGLSSD